MFSVQCSVFSVLIPFPVLPEIKGLEAQLKLILYGCVEHVQATKAALYLADSHDLNDKSYEIVTSYQYNATERKVVNANDDLVDRLAVKRNAFYVNGLGADQRFAEMLFRQGNDRLLAVPMFSRGRMLGFLDMRDKAGKKPFENPDLEAARKIADQVTTLLASKGLYGLAAIQLVDEPAPAPPAPEPPPVQTPARGTPAPAAQPSRPGQFFSAEAIRAVESARQYMTKRQHAQPGGRRALAEADLDAFRLLLPSALAVPGAVMACVSAIGQMNNPLGVVAVATVADDAMDALHAHLQAWLKKTNQPHLTVRSPASLPLGAQLVPVQAAAITAIISAPVSPQAIEGVVLTVVFERTAEAQAQRALQHFLRQMEPALDAAAVAAGARTDRQTLAERLLEPDFQRFPDLADHCREVSIVAQRFARLLELPPPQVETVRIAALVHDVGLRLLDYERLYRRASLTAEEMRGFLEHPVVGAALAEPVLGTDVAVAVLRHHERFAGKGYPSRLAGPQIPLPSRIIAVADAWVSMTSARSYKPPVPPETAAEQLREGAGSQFDPALVEKFLGALAELS